MEQIAQIFSYICVLTAAVILGNWFVAEQRKARAAGKPWYAGYLTAPGVFILILVLLLPVALRFWRTR